MPCCRCELRGATDPIRHGFTLVEVVAGLTLFAALGVGVLLAFGVHQRQLRTARQRMTALELADRVLSDFMGSPDGIPVNGRGPLPVDTGWLWRTQPVAQRLVAGLPVIVIRLDIIGARSTASAPEVLCSIEVIRPVSTLVSGVIP